MTVQLSHATFKVLGDTVKDVELGVLTGEYSGRGMHGDLCLGLTCDHPTRLVQFVFTLMRLHDEHDGVNYHVDQQLVQELSALILELEAGRTPTCQESLGYHIVYYWPGVAVER